MKVRLLTPLGTAERVFAKGEIVDLDQKNAKSLLDSGQAEPVGRKPVQKAERR